MRYCLYAYVACNLQYILIALAYLNKLTVMIHYFVKTTIDTKSLETYGSKIV